MNVTNFPQFSGRTIFSIAETDSINLWIGTDQGLVKFNRKLEIAEPIALDNKAMLVKAVFVDKKGRLLVGTSQGLFREENNRFRKILLDPNALSATNSLMAIINGEEDYVWIASNGGLIHYNIASGESQVFKNNIRKGIDYYTCLALIEKTCLLYTSPSPRDRG